jgi:hypothetical protein
VSAELERRLRESLRAYADVVDAPDDDALPTRPAAARPVLRRWRGAVLSAAAAAAVVTGALVIVDLRDTGSDTTAQSSVAAPEGTRTAAPESASGSPSDQALSVPDAAAAQGFGLPASPETGVAYPVDLYTHCGVLGIDIGGVWFAADPSLVEAGGNPPPGWGNPTQRGTVTMSTATEAVFADDAGHEVRLRADESARPPLCQ